MRLQVVVRGVMRIVGGVTSRGGGRKRIFESLNVYLERTVRVVERIDPYAEVYLFGSVVEYKYLLSSDIDILVVTSSPPGNLLAELWASGVRDPFEIHVVNLEVLEVYEKRSKLIRVDDKYK